MIDLKGYGVGLYLHAQAVDTTTPGGKALLQMAGVFAEFEREMIRERVLAGQARARACGVRFGRPTIPADKAAAIVADLKTGVGVVKLAKLHGVGLYLHAQAVDTTTAGGKALLQMAGVFAEFEREMIRERVLAGQARARASGVRFGRPTIPADKAAAIVADLKAGVGVVKLAKLHGVGVGTVQKLKARLAA